MTTVEEEKRSSLETFQLKQTIKELEKRRSVNNSTSLVTLYIPPTSQISEFSQLLTNELGTATNIKDKNTSKLVQEAIRSILARLPKIKNTENGLVIYSGHTENKGKTEFYAIKPPEPVGIKTYRCESFFDTNHLREMLDVKESIGIIVIDRGGATFALIRGNSLKIIDDHDSFVPSKHGRGGQSQGRIERGIEILAQEFYGKMALQANKIFIDEYPVKYIIVGGSSNSKNEFLAHNNIDYRMHDKVYKVYDIGYSGEFGVRELLQRAEADLGDIELIKEQKLMEQFMEELGKDTMKATYGEEAVRNALKMSAVETVLYSESLEKKFYKVKCGSCEHQFVEAVSDVNLDDFEYRIAKQNCPKCSESELEIIDEIDLIDEYQELAEQSGATIEVIGRSHDAGEQLFRAFTGVAAILRYPLNF